MPDPDARPPVERDNPHTHIAPTLFELTNHFVGDGYPYGSSPQGMDDRRAARVPVIVVTTPLP
jgi:hypothetical protein